MRWVEEEEEEEREERETKVKVKKESEVEDLAVFMSLFLQFVKFRFLGGLLGDFEFLVMCALL